jgi:hypothetical protein
MGKRRAPKIRAEFHAIISHLPSAGLSTLEIVRKLQRDHKALIELEIADIIELGLMRLAGDALQLRSGATSTAQAELFAEYAVPKKFTLRVRTPKGTKSIHKDIANITINDAELYIEQHSRPPTPKPDVAEVAGLLDLVKANGAKGTDNLMEAWKAAKKHG